MHATTAEPERLSAKIDAISRALQRRSDQKAISDPVIVDVAAPSSSVVLVYNEERASDREWATNREDERERRREPIIPASPTRLDCAARSSHSSVERRSVTGPFHPVQCIRPSRATGGVAADELGTNGVRSGSESLLVARPRRALRGRQHSQAYSRDSPS